MNREELKELGLNDEQIEAVMKSHGQTVNQTKEELTSAQSERDSLKEQLSERDTQLESLRGKAQGNEELQATIDSLKEANAQAKESYEQKLREQKFNYELERELMTAKARNPKAVRALLDTEVIKLDDDGKIKGLSEQLEGLKESDGYLFVSEEGTTPSSSNFNPGAKQKTNTPKEVDPYEAGKQRALERHKKEEK
ncbi:phage scaffolding protein [Oceanobacillus sp. J11TS1]|uniref:phage scaffolding protein n=1 Tax=Oceanobacillus sp. J11TS1 TaxID=2807191 RepID=UPI001B1C0CBA|nr:phage scaffolding protein [Oceanobacillus sp. J11TS1]GIO25103.1 scaffold protein [Oceanobacillus sp. J11TS1]